jgi:hypothetical protein
MHRYYGADSFHSGQKPPTPLEGWVFSRPDLDTSAMRKTSASAENRIGMAPPVASQYPRLFFLIQRINDMNTSRKVI